MMDKVVDAWVVADKPGDAALISVDPVVSFVEPKLLPDMYFGKSLDSLEVNPIRIALPSFVHVDTPSDALHGVLRNDAIPGIVASGYMGNVYATRVEFIFSWMLDADVIPMQIRHDAVCTLELPCWSREVDYDIDPLP